MSRRDHPTDQSEAGDPRRQTGQHHADHLPPTPPPPVAPASTPTEAERAQERMSQRAEGLRRDHWRVRQCERGHIIETHRSSAGGEDAWTRCPICGQPARRETPEATALREHREASAPQVVAKRLMDSITEWATERLNASSWTRRSEEQAKQRERSIAGNVGPFDL